MYMYINYRSAVPAKIMLLCRVVINGCNLVGNALNVMVDDNLNFSLCAYKLL